MIFMYTLEDGEFLVRLSRETIENHINKGAGTNVPGVTPEHLKEKAGVFVTLLTYPSRDLRGCIGFPEPVYPLVEATISAAVSASSQDPRFYPLMKGETENIIIEVSILTLPRLIKAKNPGEILEEIEIGRDGLIIDDGFRRGLLLPQVPVEHKWGREEFLNHTCMKAGLPIDAWKDKETNIYRFQGLVFQEKEPGGKIQEKDFKKCG